jgi:predicted nucleic-acid-binding Zn-ribbon protein
MSNPVHCPQRRARGQIRTDQTGFVRGTDKNNTVTKATSTSGTAVTLLQFNAFLSARAPERPCHDCGKTEWGVHGDADSDIVFKGFLANGISPAGTEFYPVTCRHCGITKFYATQVVERWLERHDGQVG